MNVDIFVKRVKKPLSAMQMEFTNKLAVILDKAYNANVNVSVLIRERESGVVYVTNFEEVQKHYPQFLFAQLMNCITQYNSRL